MASIKLKGDTSGEITISAPAVAGTTTLELPATSSTLATQNALGVRNLIINGDMRIDQRNAGASVTPSGFTYTIDRWYFDASQGSKFAIQRNAGSVTPPSGFSNYLGATVSSSVSIGVSDYFMLVQTIEGFNSAHLDFGTANAKTVTLSFWVRSSLTGDFGGVVKNGASNRSYPFIYTINSANTWEKKSVTIAGDTTGTWAVDNSAGLVVIFGLGVGSNLSATAGEWIAANRLSATGATSVVGTSGATFYITGVQLEVGDTATPFEHRPYDMELARCQRYFCKTFPIGTAPANNAGSTGSLKGATRHGSSSEPSANWKFPVSMRANPTVTLYNPGSGTAGQWASDGTATSSGSARSQWIGTEGCAMDNTGNAFNNLSNIHASANAEL